MGSVSCLPLRDAVRVQGSYCREHRSVPGMMSGERVLCDESSDDGDNDTDPGSLSCLGESLAVLGGILYLFLSCPVGHPALCCLHTGPWPAGLSLASSDGVPLTCLPLEEAGQHQQVDDPSRVFTSLSFQAAPGSLSPG